MKIFNYKLVTNSNVM